MNGQLFSSLTGGSTQLEIVTYRARVKRMALAGIPESKIAILLGIQLRTLRRFFARLLELCLTIASIVIPQKNSSKNKQPPFTNPIPTTAFVIRGPNGERIA